MHTPAVAAHSEVSEVTAQLTHKHSPPILQQHSVSDPFEPDIHALQGRKQPLPLRLPTQQEFTSATLGAVVRETETVKGRH